MLVSYGAVPKALSFRSASCIFRRFSFFLSVLLLRLPLSIMDLVVCLELQFFVARPFSIPVSLKPSVKSSNSCSSVSVMLPAPPCRLHMPRLGSTTRAGGSRTLSLFAHHCLSKAESTVSTRTVNTIGLKRTPFGSLLVVQILLDVKCPSLVSKLCCSHSCEVHANCCFPTPCSHCSQRLVSVHHSLALLAAVKMLNAICSRWLSFAKAV